MLSICGIKYRNNIKTRLVFYMRSRKSFALISFEGVTQVGYCKVKCYETKTKPPKKTPQTKRETDLWEQAALAA